VEREDIVTPIKAFIEKHPVLTYYALVFAISWGGILMLVAPGGIPGEPEDVARLFPTTLAALFAGPSVAGVVMTALVSGRAGLRELLARLGRWRVGAACWAAALLTGPVLVAAVLFGLSLYSPDFVPGLLTTEDKFGLLIFGLGWGPGLTLRMNPAETGSNLLRPAAVDLAQSPSLAANNRPTPRVFSRRWPESAGKGRRSHGFAYRRRGTANALLSVL